MKIRWRTHELVLVTICAAWFLVIYLLRLQFVPEVRREEIYAPPFYAHGLPFNYFQQILLLQLVILLLQYGCYSWLHWIVIPKAVSCVKEKNKRPRILFYGAGLILQIAAIIYLLGPVSNFIFYYLSPYSTHPGILFSLFPTHPQPLTNTFGGFGIAASIVCIYLIYAAIRETVIHFLEKPGALKNYRVLICNQVTAFAALYPSVYPFLRFSLSGKPADDIQTGLAIYFLVIPSVLLVFLFNIYWLYPSKKVYFPLRLRMLPLLLLIPFACALPVLLSANLWQQGAFPIVWAIGVFTVTPLSWLIYQQRKDKVLQLRGVEKELVQSKADLQLLRSQINPHFLFNTLNTLYGTALREGSPDTAKGIQQLGDMMRFMLHDNNRDFIDVDKEIAYLKNYISLQQLRIPASSQITIDYDISGEYTGRRIAPMLLIPFVENAFKYGISFKEKSWVHISLQCHDDIIHFGVRNSVHPAVAGHAAGEQSGIGIRNVKERLQWVYPGKHTLTIQPTEHEYMVKLQLRT